MRYKSNNRILILATIFSDWSLFLLLLYVSFIYVNGSFYLKKKDIFSCIVVIVIAFIYTAYGLSRTDPLFVIKNSLIFWLLPTLYFIRGYSLPKKTIDVMILVLFAQCFVVIVLHLIGFNVYNRVGAFSYFLGYYSGGGTVVSFRFYSYKLVLLMALIFIRFLYFKHSPERSYFGLISSVVISGSKALALSLVLALSLLVMKTKGARKLILFVVVFCAMSVMSASFPIFSLIMAVFDVNDASNETRLTVYRILLGDPWSILIGNGFGYPLPSNLIRDAARPYGFEISYLSYLHKIGLSLVWISWIISKQLKVKGVVALIPIWIAALGNPTLSHLYNIFLIAIIIGLRK